METVFKRIAEEQITKSHIQKRSRIYNEIHMNFSYTKFSCQPPANLP